ncbi:MAG: TadE/TadG family type IV pilus assembly protein [Aestuariivirga sp.]
MSKKFKRGFLKSADGVAAIEAVFVIPLMCVLYFGTLDLTSLILYNTKLTNVATFMSDTVAQYPNTIRRSDITDIENGIKLITSSSQATKVQVDVYDYRLVGKTITKIWSTKSPNATNCSAPSTANLSSLMTTGNDVIVATSCMTYTPWLATLFGKSLLGLSSFSLTQTFTAVPYGSATLNCYTGSTGTTPCAEI